MVWVVWAEGQSAIKDDGVVVKRDVASHATPVGTARFAARHDAEYKVTHTGLWVSSVGVGTYIGEANDATDRMVTSAIVASARAGVNHVDTASNYRKGRGERAVGAALRELFAEGVSRDELVIATKAGFVVGDVAREARRYGATSADFDASGRHCVAPACIKASLDVSLERLGVSTVDILYLHNVCEKRTDLEAPQIASLLRTAFGHLEIERRNERIRYYGLATFSLTFRAPPGTRGGFRLATDVWPLLPVDHGFRFVQLPVTLDMPEAFAEKWEFRGGEPATLNATAAALGVDIVSSKSLGGRRRRRRGGWMMEFTRRTIRARARSTSRGRLPAS
ncbi:hypothetical protein CTAYLR_004943 [Chrysophaeum taylorii]|uniref:NADP-dependent oxidoreductase domain-containing protein n=1 Tax=Chrysophaeum taylorii TaxID=2483200 RepID=A0AAD7XUZ1_9STRA|nr:hypothetical protein CTAYLR_004943 [Chrysophaeum taylorii]